MNYFIYNNKNSLKEFKLYFETLPLLPLTGFGESDDPVITCSVGFKNKKDNIKKIRSWLSSIEGTLKFSFDDRIWTVNNVTTREVKRNKTYIQIDIMFYVDRYCKLENGNIEIINNFENIEILNKGNFISLPLITVFGDGDIDIFINSQNFSIKNVNYSVTLDSEIEECWDGTNDNIISLKNMDTYGAFLFFEEGSNILSIFSTGIINKVIINPRWNQ